MSDKKNQFSAILCNSLINVLFKLGRVEIPIRSLDTVVSAFSHKDANERGPCVVSIIPDYFVPSL